jgi:hypothetical protein
MSSFTLELQKLLNDIDDAINDLDILTMEINFDKHLGKDASDINPLAYKRLKIEKFLVQSLLDKNIKNAERWYEIYCMNFKNIIKDVLSTDSKSIITCDNEVIENGHQVYLNEITHDICKYKAYLKFIQI